LGIADACDSCRWLGPATRSGVHNYCMHKSSNWSRGQGEDPDTHNTKWIKNARKDDLRNGQYWGDQCGSAAKYWEPKDG